MNKLSSFNPATNQLIDEVIISTPDEIVQKVKAAQAAKKQWKALGVQKRLVYLRPLIAIFKKYADELKLLTTLEMGKRIKECQDDFTSDFDYFEAFLNDGPKYIEDEMTVHEGTKINRIVYEPRGVVACIVPWNFPFTNFVWSVIPNLLVGNTVVFKHSEECPLFGKKIEELMKDFANLPEGVFNVVHGGAEVGWQLAQSDINMIWFTGSSATGRKLSNLAGKKHIKAVLEMGGSNPAIVFADADLDTLMPKIYTGRFANCGQICDAIKRVIVHRSIHDEFIRRLRERLVQLQIGDPALEKTEIGPLASMRQLELLEAQVNASVKQGAEIVIGGARPAHLSGAYYLPTVLTSIDKNMPVWCEEVFGPVLPIMPFDSEEEAVSLANDTIYGLGAAVFSRDLELARRVAAQIDAGFVEINEGSHWHTRNPFGGYKASGMGCEHGRNGFQELCHIKVLAEA